MRPGRDDTALPVAGFWARRRAAVRAEAAAAKAGTEAAARAATRDAGAGVAATRDAATRDAGAGDDRQSDAEILAGLGLKDPETMGIGDDFAAFLRAEVPERLRRQALRRLWRSNPVLANLDGLVDHGEDYTDAATVVPGMRTAYQVGRGIVTEVLALADGVAAGAAPDHGAAGPAAAAPDLAADTVADPPADAMAETPAETPADTIAAAPADAVADRVPAAAPTPPAASAAAPTPPAASAATAAADAIRPPRHMRFVFAS